MRWTFINYYFNGNYIEFLLNYLPCLNLTAWVASRSNKLLSHSSMGSPIEYLMGSFKVISFSNLAPVPERSKNNKFQNKKIKICTLIRTIADSILLSKLSNQFQRQWPASAFIAVDSGTQENWIRSHQLFYEIQRDTGSFVDHKKVRRGQFVTVFRENELNELSIIFYFTNIVKYLWVLKMFIRIKQLLNSWFVDYSKS